MSISATSSRRLTILPFFTTHVGTFARKSSTEVRLLRRLSTSYGSPAITPRLPRRMWFPFESKVSSVSRKAVRLMRFHSKGCFEVARRPRSKSRVVRANSLLRRHSDPRRHWCVRWSDPRRLSLSRRPSLRTPVTTPAAAATATASTGLHSSLPRRPDPDSFPSPSDLSLPRWREFLRLLTSLDSLRYSTSGQRREGSPEASAVV